MSFYSSKSTSKDEFLVQTPYGKGLITRTRSNPKSSAVDSVSPSPSTKIHEIRLLEWENAVKATSTSRRLSKPAMLYTSIQYPSVEIQKGDDVVTPYGRGRVINTVTVRIRDKQNADIDKQTDNKVMEDAKEEEGESTKENEDEEEKKGIIDATSEQVLTKYQIQLSSWRLAKRSTIKCFLFQSQQDVMKNNKQSKNTIRVVRKKTLGEMNPHERVEFSLRQKSSATILFTQKSYQQALNTYAGAIDSIRYIQHDNNSSNELRADLVQVMVTCSNNAATCCIQLGINRYDDAKRFAQNALVLLDSLYSKRGLKIHGILKRDAECGKLSDSKLFGEWRVKSLLVVAQVLMEKEKDYNEATVVLKRARDVASYYTTPNNGIKKEEKEEVDEASIARLKNLERQIKKRMAKANEKKKAILQKEKARAKAMFGSATSATTSNGTNTTTTTSSFGNGEASSNNSTNAAITNGDANTETSTAPIHKDTATPSLDTTPTKKKDTLPPIIKDRATSSPKEVNDPTSLNTPAKLARRVSFSPNLEETKLINSRDEEDVYVEGEEDTEDEEPWYEEHKEAMILLATGGLAALSILMMRKK